MLADPVVIILVNHDEVVRTAEQNHGSEDSSLYRNAMGHVNDHRVII